MELSPAFQSAYQKLNTAQKRVVDAIDGPVMVIAGPGTGKTQVLGLRVANILKQREVAPNNILCLTFTDAGAINMRERLAQFMGADAYRVGIYTFHAFCNAIIGRHPEYFYEAATFSAADDIGRSEIIEELFASLPHGHPLSSFHPEDGYVYRRAVVDRIKHIKSAGFAPDEYRSLVATLLKEVVSLNDCVASWPDRLSLKAIGIVEEIQRKLSETQTVYGVFLAKTLGEAIQKAKEEEKTGAVGDWKKKFLEKNEQEKLVLKDVSRKERILAVADMYKAYEDALHKRALYDYDDMIIDVRRALEENSTLRSIVEEQYQYILVDEFQDTNEAQLRLVTILSSNPVYERKPNVMVVGDDDQAIFKFQGAELSNVTNFTRMYDEVDAIVLDTNYRSHRVILDAARKVILQGTYRLENILSITKELSVGNKELKDGNVLFLQYQSDVEEYSNIAEKIRKLIEKGEDPDDICVIAHKHAQLKAFLPYLDHKAVPYSYIRRESVFREPHVRELITVCSYLSSCHGEQERKDYLLPEILSSPSFGISRVKLFEIAIRAKDERKSWAQLIAEMGEGEVGRAYQLLANLAGEQAVLPLEHVLDRYMKESHFRTYYFGDDALHQKPTQYVAFLASLKTFIEALRSWRDGEPLFVKDVAPFVSLYESGGIDLVSTSPFIRGGKSVQVMTAHKSKGLEFGNVFIIGAHEDVWAKSGRANIAPVPAPLLPMIAPAGEDEDDFIRLLYVALTRAKHTLSVSGHAPLVRYLGEVQEVVTDGNGALSEIILSHEQTLFGERNFTGDEKAMLGDALKDYRLSVTHLNNFLDVKEGGPLYFLEQNLLRFPQPMNVAGTFGSAIDAAITEFIRYPKYNAGEFPDDEHVMGVFRKELAKGRLPQAEAKKQLVRGEEVLAAYFKKKKKYFRVEDETQVDFRNEGVVIGSAPVSGKLDFLRKDKDGYIVVDFKTGKASGEWTASKMEVFEKIKLHKYKQQLMFYALLLRGSKRHSAPVLSLTLEYVESAKDGEIVQLSYSPTEGELNRLALLIDAVYKKIIALDFPDVSTYPPTLEGMLQFEDDLIEGRV